MNIFDQIENAVDDGFEKLELRDKLLEHFDEEIDEVLEDVYQDTHGVEMEILAKDGKKKIIKVMKMSTGELVYVSREKLELN